MMDVDSIHCVNAKQCETGRNTERKEKGRNKGNDVDICSILPLYKTYIPCCHIHIHIHTPPLPLAWEKKTDRGREKRSKSGLSHASPVMDFTEVKGKDHRDARPL